jgi:hypothetical protein
VDIGMPALSQDAPSAKAPVTQQHISRAQAVPERLQKAQFMLMPVAGRPGGEQTCRQAQKSDDPYDGEATARLLHRLLGKGGLVFGSIGGGHGGAIGGKDAMTTPEILGGDGTVGFGHQVILDLL